MTAAVIVAGCVGVGLALSRTTVASSALAARRHLDRGARRALGVMARYAPPSAATEHIGVPIGEAAMDVYLPEQASAGTPVPVVVWVHGGAWISGRSADVAPYLRLLAREGYAAVAVDYTVAPEAAYPTPLHEVDAALAALVAHADEWGVDPSRIVLAGDSAGAQIVTQALTLILEPARAEALGIAPVVAPSDIRGLIVHSGVFDIAGLAVERGLLARGLNAAVWAYTGAADWATLPRLSGLSVTAAVSGAFPPVLVSGGDADPLTARQSHPFRDALEAAGVPVTALFWERTRPRLGHEYQFDLDRPEARRTLAATISFLGEVTAQGDGAGAASAG
ncbi:alpha/beta hydrolase [Mycetocola reblochoni]|uniref:Esterase/lipase n=2 Tax=Mycetocola reblochoni TaxID=331618 RepID=A0A1R4IU03_9MICO|nr:alpha/beta hydrolase [Mycetocola reblochoni]RLP71059.1 alpha/beta hydrolase [Mycetocola reblochoni]SJN23065.1 Esterase/lipase [Mycetocola reblochoni REB411]